MVLHAAGVQPFHLGTPGRRRLTAGNLAADPLSLGLEPPALAALTVHMRKRRSQCS